MVNQQDPSGKVDTFGDEQGRGFAVPRLAPILRVGQETQLLRTGAIQRRHAVDLGIRVAVYLPGNALSQF